MSSRVRVVRRTVVVALATCGLLAFASVPALAARGHIFGFSFGSHVNKTAEEEGRVSDEDVCPAPGHPDDLCQSGISGTGAGEFSSAGSVAVNEAEGFVYVADGDRVERFSSNGVYETEFNGSGANAWEGEPAPTGHVHRVTGVAVDNDPVSPSYGDVYVVDDSNYVVDKFNANGAYINQITEAPPGISLSAKDELFGVAVDPAGHLFVDVQEPILRHEVVTDRFSNAAANSFEALIELREQAGYSFIFECPGFAVDGSGHIFVTSTELGCNRGGHGAYVLEDGASGEFVRDEVGGVKHATAVATEQATGDVYVAEAGGVAHVTAEDRLVERFGEGLLTGAAGLAVDSSSEDVYVADHGASDVATFVPEPPGEPVILGESIAEVTGDSATFEAEVIPRGNSTEYRFEYGRCGAQAIASCAASGYEHATPEPDLSIGSGWEVRHVSAHVSGLAAGATYHFRLVAHNVGGEATKEETFSTQVLGGALILPDGRQWELVSPPDKHGQLIHGLGYLAVTQAAADGHAITYVASGATEEGAQGSGHGAQILSTRSQAGWNSEDIATPRTSSAGYAVGHGEEYRAFSEGLATGVVEPEGSFSPLTACSPVAAPASDCVSEESPLATEQTLYLRHNLTCSQDLSSCYEPLVTAVEGCSDVPPETEFGETAKSQGVDVGGISPDGQHVLIDSRRAKLTEEPRASVPGLYEWSANRPCTERLQAVSEGEAELGAHFYKGNTRGAISTDGSRVFYTTKGEAEEMYDLERHETVAIPGIFQDATPNGSRVFYDSGVCDIVLEAEKLVCKPMAGFKSVSGLMALNPGGSRNGEYDYFIATGVATTEPTAAGEVAIEGRPNLYADHYDAGTGEWEEPRLVAVLSEEDSSDWGDDAQHTQLTKLTAEVSPNGRYLAFMSRRPLTGYDNEDAIGRALDQEVFLYDYQTGEVSCVSCNPTGARPDGVETGSGAQTEEEALLGNNLANGTWFSGILPGYPKYRLDETLHQPRYLTDKGQLFFDSAEALVPQDVNGQVDVYEYELPGVGTCSMSSPTYSERDGGCVGLISGGESTEESAFLDASESGGDVFFLTAAKLLPRQDYDTTYDVYDAHECSGESPCFSKEAATPLSCENAESCREAAQPQPAIFAAAGSAMFSGPGDLTPAKPGTSMPAGKGKSAKNAHKRKLRRALKRCAHRHSRRKRRRCERRVRRRLGGQATEHTQRHHHRHQRRHRRGGSVHRGRWSARSGR